MPDQFAVEAGLAVPGAVEFDLELRNGAVYARVRNRTPYRLQAVTVVWGRADRIIPAAQAGSVTGAVSHLIDGAGHMPQMERPAEVQAAIEEAIARAG